MANWTRAMVADRLDLAVEVMRAMPPVRPQGYVSAWPEYLSSFADKVEQEPKMKRPLPSPRMITEADEAMLWLRWLDKEIGQILWLRASRKPWKLVCWEIGISRATANRHWQYGIAVIVWRLNGRRLSARKPMGHMIRQAREV